MMYLTDITEKRLMRELCSLSRFFKQLFILTFLLVAYSQNLMAQENINGGRSPSEEADLSCFYKKKYTSAQRKGFYPFDVAETIKLVSFRYHKHNYPIRGDKLIADSLFEIKSLDKEGINKLTDILYNNFYRKKPDYGLQTQCFFPRNAILFFDKQGNLKESILLCFHCDRHQESSEKIDFGNNCSEKMEKLRRYFIKVGLQFGTDRSIDIYPGESDY